MPGPPDRYRKELGLTYPGANHRLARMLLFDLLEASGRAACFRCGEEIKDYTDMTIDHKIPWRAATNARERFFDLRNIAFSHHSCNSKVFQTHCKNNHPLSGDNLYRRPDGARVCRECSRAKTRRWYNRRGRELRKARHA